MQLDFSHNTYTVRQNIFNLFGSTIKVLDDQNEPLLYCRKKAFKLKEDIRIFHDEARTQEVFRISARNIIDFSAIYDIIDSETNQTIGSLRRKGLKSLLKDEWEILDAQGSLVGLIKEDSRLMALLRRFLSSLIPQTFNVLYGETKIAEYVRGFNPFVNKMRIDFSLDTHKHLDHRIGLASAVLILLMEARG